MRFCPLAHVSIPCSEAAPLCPWCAQHDAAAQAVSAQPGQPASRVTPLKECADCHKPFAPASNHQARCRPCGAMRQKTKNAGYQQTFRQRKAISS
jgi:hypothetical protein